MNPIRALLKILCDPKPCPLFPPPPPVHVQDITPPLPNRDLTARVPFQIGQGVLFRQGNRDWMPGIIESIHPSTIGILRRGRGMLGTYPGYCTVKTVTEQGIRIYGLISFNQIQTLVSVEQERIERVMRDAIQAQEAQTTLSRVRQEAQNREAARPNVHVVPMPQDMSAGLHIASHEAEAAPQPPSPPPPPPEPEVEKDRRILFKHKDPDKSPDTSVSGG